MLLGLSYTLWVNIVFTLGIAVVVISFALPAIRGAMYAPTSPHAVKLMMQLLQVEAGKRAIDIGSGDGRIVIAFAQAGLDAYGVESNLFLVLWSRYKIRRAGVQHHAHVYWNSFRRINYANYEYVTLFGIFYIMKSLEAQLQRELPAGGRVVSNHFAFPHWNAAKSEEDLHLYIQSSL